MPPQFVCNWFVHIENVLFWYYYACLKYPHAIPGGVDFISYDVLRLVYQSIRYLSLRNFLNFSGEILLQRNVGRQFGVTFGFIGFINFLSCFISCASVLLSLFLSFIDCIRVPCSVASRSPAAPFCAESSAQGKAVTERIVRYREEESAYKGFRDLWWKFSSEKSTNRGKTAGR